MISAITAVICGMQRQPHENGNLFYCIPPQASEKGRDFHYHDLSPATNKALNCGCRQQTNMAKMGKKQTDGSVVVAGTKREYQ